MPKNDNQNSKDQTRSSDSIVSISPVGDRIWQSLESGFKFWGHTWRDILKHPEKRSVNRKLSAPRDQRHGVSYRWYRSEWVDEQRLIHEDARLKFSGDS